MGGTAFSAQPFWQHTHLCRSKRMTTEQERDFPDRPDEARGVRIPEESSSQEAEDVLDPEGYDESQRAEILEAEGRGPTNGVIQTRSEEHTSELQSLMRISYAVFCL